VTRQPSLRFAKLHGADGARCHTAENAVRWKWRRPSAEVSRDFEIRKLIVDNDARLAEVLLGRRLRFRYTRELHLQSTWQRFRLL
jgi:hypothetical protein